MKAQILICVGGLTVHRGAEMDPSSSLLRKMSRKGSSHPTASPLRTVCKGATVEMVVKGVNQVGGSAVKVSSTYLLQNRGGAWKVVSASCSTSSIARFATTTHTVDVDLPVYFAFKGRSGASGQSWRRGGRCHPQRDWSCLEEMGHSSNGIVAEGGRGERGGGCGG